MKNEPKLIATRYGLGYLVKPAITREIIEDKEYISWVHKCPICKRGVALYYPDAERSEKCDHLIIYETDEDLKDEYSMHFVFIIPEKGGDALPTDEKGRLEDG